MKKQLNHYSGKKALIVGLGLSGVAAARYLCNQGTSVTVSDIKSKEELHHFLLQCSDLPIQYELGNHSVNHFQTADFIVVSPGVPLNLPVLKEARLKNIPIMGEIDLALSKIQLPIIAVTGTNGKTTTVTLIGEMLRAAQKEVYVGGNIGRPLLDYLNFNIKADCIVLELSSFQLELIQNLTPHIAVFTNLEADHLDRYPSFQAYCAAKKRLLQFCNGKSNIVFNYDQEHLAPWIAEVTGNLFYFTKNSITHIEKKNSKPFSGAYLNKIEKKLILKSGNKEEILTLAQCRLFGEHNHENLMAAAIAAHLMGVSKNHIQSVIDTFPGVPHRLEFIRKKSGVFFFNDSKGTNVMSVQRSLAAFKVSPVILIAGGKDKETDFSSLCDLVKKKCKILILLGEAKEKMNRILGDFTETYLVGTFEEAVLLAYQKSRSGDVILLSPGCSSHDMFRNYEERGDYFKKLVTQL